jgi:hypothetical protein
MENINLPVKEVEEEVYSRRKLIIFKIKFKKNFLL